MNTPIGLDLYHEALSKGYDPEQRILNLLQAVLGTFDVERAWLAYPCNPDSQVFSIHLRQVVPEYDSDAPLSFPVSPAVRNVIIKAHQHQQAFAYYSRDEVVDELG